MELISPVVELLGCIAHGDPHVVLGNARVGVPAPAAWERFCSSTPPCAAAFGGLKRRAGLGDFAGRSSHGGPPTSTITSATCRSTASSAEVNISLGLMRLGRRSCP